MQNYKKSAALKKSSLYCWKG